MAILKSGQNKQKIPEYIFTALRPGRGRSDQCGQCIGVKVSALLDVTRHPPLFQLPLTSGKLNDRHQGLKISGLLDVTRHPPLFQLSLTSGELNDRHQGLKISALLDVTHHPPLSQLSLTSGKLNDRHQGLKLSLTSGELNDRHQGQRSPRRDAPPATVSVVTYNALLDVTRHPPLFQLSLTSGELNDRHQGLKVSALLDVTHHPPLSQLSLTSGELNDRHQGQRSPRRDAPPATVSVATYLGLDERKNLKNDEEYP
ncbi:hypothetical protein J6590_085535 [Homalodisca vitripennis]|nr:hypothetical protein J6590_085535 [Homalodisca vitripennis]